ncbi:hypothetical protein QL285_055867 [Trifolium repens]|nr:hypothetical protein QL285_055867 [Trifolium repens]
MEQAIKLLQNNIKQKDEQLAAIDSRRKKISDERGEMITTLKSLQNMTTNIDQSSTPTTSLDKVLKDKENWDLLGQPSGKYDYYVKYTAPESSEIPIEAVTPSGWKSNSNEEQEAESSGTTSNSKKSWVEEVEEEDEARKNGVPTFQQSVSVDPIDQQMGKYAAYVIFEGPFKGIYRSWAIAKQHVIGKNIRHKGYKTMEEAEIALYGSYREIATAKNLQRSPTMESKKKLSIDKIRQLEHQKNFQITDPTYMEFSLRWKWLNHYNEVFTTECFYPVNKFNCTRAVLLPGIDSQICLSFFQNGLINTIYLEEQPGKVFGELKYLPKELQNLTQKFNSLFAKGKEIFLQIDSTYPWYDENTLELVTKPQYLIKIGISNKQYPTMSKESSKWHPSSYIAQIKNFHQKVSRLFSQNNYRIVYENSTMVVYSDSRKPAKEKDINAVKNLEARVDQLKEDYEKLPRPIREECCRIFSQYYKGHNCKNCLEKLQLPRKIVGTRRQGSC